jgi:hypothetical protein
MHLTDNSLWRTMPVIDKADQVNICKLKLALDPFPDHSRARKQARINQLRHACNRQPIVANNAEQPGRYSGKNWVNFALNLLASLN